MARKRDRLPLGDAAPANRPFAALAPRLAEMLPQLSAAVPADPPAAPGATDPPAAQNDLAVAAQVSRQVVLQMERKGRGGKVVTLIQRTGLAQPLLAQLARAVGQALGCGTSVEGDQVLVQGNQSVRLRQFLQAVRLPQGAPRGKSS